MDTEEIPAEEQITRGRESPSLVLGPRRLHYQYSVSLPQFNLTLISVLQGLAFGVLLSNIPLFPPDPSTSLADYIWQQHLFLPFVTSSLLILLIWLQFMYGAMFITWPVSTLQTALVYLLALTEIVTFAEIGHLPAWIAGLGFVAIVGGCHRLSNLRWQRGLEYISAKAERSWRRAQLSDGVMYIILGSLYVVLGLNYDAIIQAIATALPSWQVDPWGALAVTLLVLCGSSVNDTYFRRKFLREVAEGSDLVILPHGTVAYRPLVGAQSRVAASAQRRR